MIRVKPAPEAAWTMQVIEGEAIRKLSFDEEGNVLGELRPTGIIPAFHKHLKRRGIDLPVKVFGMNIGLGD